MHVHLAKLKDFLYIDQGDPFYNGICKLNSSYIIIVDYLKKNLGLIAILIIFCAQNAHYSRPAPDIDPFMEIFVPGRLCILGEHSDWAGEYRKDNKSIAIGKTVVCATVEGLFARCTPGSESSNMLSFRHKQLNGEWGDLDVLLDVSELDVLAKLGGFFAYIAGTASVVLTKHESTIRERSCGIHIENYRTTLPMCKGLSSSAAACVMVVKCFAAVFCLKLSLEEIMEVHTSSHLCDVTFRPFFNYVLLAS